MHLKLVMWYVGQNYLPNSIKFHAALPFCSLRSYVHCDLLFVQSFGFPVSLFDNIYVADHSAKRDGTFIQLDCLYDGGNNENFFSILFIFSIFLSTPLLFHCFPFPRNQNNSTKVMKGQFSWVFINWKWKDFGVLRSANMIRVLFICFSVWSLSLKSQTCRSTIIIVM